MHAYDFEACVFDGEIYCNECLPDGVDTDCEDVHPVFADSEWDYYPTCCACGETHDYVSLTTEGREYETQRTDN
jgi:hypothetical protein